MLKRKIFLAFIMLLALISQGQNLFYFPITVKNSVAGTHDLLTLQRTDTAYMGIRYRGSARVWSTYLYGSSFKIRDSVFGDVAEFTSSGNTILHGSLSLLETGSSPQYYTVFQSGDLSASKTFTWPTGYGSSGQVLQTNGSGTLSWTNAFSSSDTAAMLAPYLRSSTAATTYQPALSGTGFVKISGSTISYDNSTYLTSSSAASTYLALSGGTLTGPLINAYTSLVSSPASTLTGTWYAGGSSTTTKPHLLVEPSGTSSTTWSTSGTGLGINAASGFVGDLINLSTAGVNRLKVAGSGTTTIGGFLLAGTDATYDIGQVAANRFRNFYCTGGITGGADLTLGNNATIAPSNGNLNLNSNGIGYAITLTGGAQASNACVLLKPGSNLTGTSQSQRIAEIQGTIAPSSGAFSYYGLYIPITIAVTGAVSGFYSPEVINYTINNTGTANTGTATGLYVNATETALNGMTHNLFDFQIASTSILKLNANTAGSRYTLSMPSTNAQVVYGSATAEANSRLTLDANPANYTAISMRKYGANNDGSYVIMTANRNTTTPSSFTTLIADDRVGGFLFKGADGGAFRNLAFISAEVDGTPGSSDMPGRLVFSVTPDGSTTLSEAMRINNAQAVGIGTGSSINSSAILHLASTTRGFLPPVMTGAQAEAISSPAEGLMVYANNGNGATVTTTGWWGYNGSTWTKLN